MYLIPQRELSLTPIVSHLFSEGLYLSAKKLNHLTVFEKLVVRLNTEPNTSFNWIYSYCEQNLTWKECVEIALILARISKHHALIVINIAMKKSFYLSFRCRLAKLIIEVHYSEEKLNIFNYLLTYIVKNNFDRNLLQINLKRSNCGMKFLSTSCRNDSITNGPLVSIIVPTWNTSQYVEKCIKSLTLQNYKNLEIIVVDDMSNDGTYEKVLSLSKTDVRIKVTRTSERSGTYIARNIGIKCASGFYCTFLDSDDVACIERISKHVKAMTSNDYVATISNWVRFDKLGFAKNRMVWPYVRLNVGSLFFIREKIVNDVGLFHEVKFAADGEYLARIKRHYGQEKIFRLNKILTIATYRSNSLTSCSLTGYGDSICNIDRLTYREQWEKLHNQKYQTQAHKI